MMTVPLLRLALVAAFALGLAGCDSQQQEEAGTASSPRAIKYMRLGQVAAADSRILSGIVKAGTQSSVAFEVAGRVTLLDKRVGETVQTGDRVAALDPEPFELRVQEAQFALRQAEAKLKDAQQKFAQQKELWEKRITTRTAYDTAVSNLSNAQGQVGIAQSQLELRQRDVQKTRLEAPFPGRIAEKKVEVFEEVAAGQAIYVLQTEDENEVEVVIPENLIDRIILGAQVSVAFPHLGGAEVPGIVTEVSPVAGDANAFPIRVLLTNAPAEVRPGMSAEVKLTFETGATGIAYSIPIGALKPDIEAKTATVFVFDETEGVVRSRPVQVVGLEGNEPQIVGGVKAGEIIATAGVGHMYDGMKVRLLEPGKLF